MKWGVLLLLAGAIALSDHLAPYTYTLRTTIVTLDRA